ncbi:MAG: hypothetical protein AAF871_04730 [Pseudomonadota bacterium]
MTIRATHELHSRRFSRNRGVAILLVSFIAVVFGLTVVKVQHVGATQGFDHVLRPEMLAPDGTAVAE